MGKDKTQLEKEYKIIMDFDNRRASAHASLFVASMFGSFGLLTLLTRMVDKNSVISLCEGCAIVILFLSYLVMWVFGLYSLLNFNFYATVAFYAEQELGVGETAKTLVRCIQNESEGVFKRFAYFRVPPEGQARGRTSGFYKDNKGNILVALYVVFVLILPLVAFLLWLWG